MLRIGEVEGARGVWDGGVVGVGVCGGAGRWRLDELEEVLGRGKGWKG